MPTYKLTDPVTGKPTRVTMDAPPTAEDLEDIFSGGAPVVPPAPSTFDVAMHRSGASGAIELGTGLLKSLGAGGNRLLQALGSLDSPPGYDPARLLSGGVPSQQVFERQGTGQAVGGAVGDIGVPLLASAAVPGSGFLPLLGGAAAGTAGSAVMGEKVGGEDVAAGLVSALIPQAARGIGKVVNKVRTPITRQSVNTLLGAKPRLFRSGRDPAKAVLNEAFGQEAFESTGALKQAVSTRLDELGKAKFETLAGADDVKLDRVIDSLNASAERLQAAGDVKAAKALRKLATNVFRKGKPLDGKAGSTLRSAIDAESVKDVLSKKAFGKTGLKSDIGGEVQKARRLLDEDLAKAAEGYGELNTRIRNLAPAARSLEAKTEEELARGLPTGLAAIKKRLSERVARSVAKRTVRPGDFAELVNPKTGRPVFVRE